MFISLKSPEGHIVDILGEKHIKNKFEANICDMIIIKSKYKIIMIESRKSYNPFYFYLRYRYKYARKYGIQNNIDYKNLELTDDDIERLKKYDRYDICSESSSIKILEFPIFLEKIFNKNYETKMIYDFSKYKLIRLEHNNNIPKQDIFFVFLTFIICLFIWNNYMRWSFVCFIVFYMMTKDCIFFYIKNHMNIKLRYILSYILFCHDFYYGRDIHMAKMINKLHNNHTLCILGSLHVAPVVEHLKNKYGYRELKQLTTF